jgi:5-methylcytosine-specific restriction protein A
MPFSPKKPCSSPGCGVLVDRKQGYCAKHKRERNAAVNANRESTDKFYNTQRWKKLRAFYRKRHPLCEECQKEGRVTPSVIVDHVNPIKEGGSPLDWDNLQALCWSCHSKKTLRDWRGGVKSPARTVPAAHVGLNARDREMNEGG